MHKRLLLLTSPSTESHRTNDNIEKTTHLLSKKVGLLGPQMTSVDRSVAEAGGQAERAKLPVFWFLDFNFR
jgi:hypothetical protein